MVHHRARRSVGRNVPYRVTVFNHIVSRTEPLQDHLVAPGDILQKGYALHNVAAAQIFQRHSHIVVGIDFDVLHQKLK